MSSKTGSAQHAAPTASLSARGADFDLHDRRPISRSSLDGLRERIAGDVVLPDDPAYAATHRIWNQDRQRRPAIIVRCAVAEDAASGVRFAREHGLPLAVRGGGYGPSGSSTCDGGIVLDLRSMRRVRVDPLGRTASVQAGATWGLVDAATQRFGYAVPGTPLSHIGVAGSTVGGGFGHLRRAYGLACDNLTSADLVTADGIRITASGDEHSELLWGLRGGGGNFGIVTTLGFRLRPLPEPVLSGSVIYAGERAGELLRFYRDYTAGLRPDVTTKFSLFGAPHSAQLTQTVGVMPPMPVVSITVACIGHPVEAEALVRPLRQAAPVLADRVAPQPYVRLQARGDEVYPPGGHADVASDYVDGLDDELIAALCERHSAMPAGSAELQLHHMGGAVGRVARMSTAVPNRGAQFLLSAIARWTEPADGRPLRQWLRDTGERVRPYRVGGPHVGLNSAPVSSVEAYGAERYLRLAALKRTFDPDNVFAGNQNVLPLA
ncbi:MAG TPA: FAD-binding oxidoreductase [Jatrophihabitans sp.]|nr:FAD-binding oxidoreductase [Jatrophihabitans sp.]